MVEIRKSRCEDFLLKIEASPGAPVLLRRASQMGPSSAPQLKLEGLPTMVQAVLSDDSTSSHHAVPEAALHRVSPRLDRISLGSSFFSSQKRKADKVPILYPRLILKETMSQYSVSLCEDEICK